MEIVQVVSGGIALSCIVFDIIAGFAFYVGEKTDEPGLGGCALVGAVASTFTLIISGCVWIVASLAL